jgi:hypothetical protein
MEREVLKTALAPGPSCLSMEQLGRYADGALGGAEKAAAADHVSGCLNCQAELALLQAVTSTGVRREEAGLVRDGVALLEQRAPEIFGAAPSPAEAPSRRRWLGLGMPSLAAAAALVAVLVAGGLFLRGPRAPELPRDVTTGGEITRSLAVSVIGPIGDQQDTPARLQWRPVQGAARYRVRLMEVDRHEIWSASTSETEAELPPAVLPAIAPGRTLIWEVTAFGASGTMIAQSGPQTFRLVRR